MQLAERQRLVIRRRTYRAERDNTSATSVFRKAGLKGWLACWFWPHRAQVCAATQEGLSARYAAVSSPDAFYFPLSGIAVFYGQIPKARTFTIRFQNSNVAAYISRTVVYWYSLDLATSFTVVDDNNPHGNSSTGVQSYTITATAGNEGPLEGVIRIDMSIAWTAGYISLRNVEIELI